MPTHTFNFSWPEKIRLLSHAIVWLVVLLIIIVAFVSFSPAMPAAGLDPSWKYGLNQARVQGLFYVSSTPFVNAIDEIQRPHL